MFINAMMSCLVKLNGDGMGGGIVGGHGRSRNGWEGGGRIMRYTFKF